MVLEKTVKGILSVFGGRLATTILTLILTPVLVRILGASDYGVYAVLISVLSLATTLTKGGISTGLRKFIAEERSVPSWSTLVFSFYFQLGILLAVSGAVLLSLLAYTGILDAAFDPEFELYFYILAAVILCRQIIYLFRFTLMGLQLEHYSESLNVLHQILFTALAILLAYLGLGVSGVLIGMVLAALLSSIVALFVIRSHIDVSRVFSLVPSSFPTKRLISYNVSNTVFIFLTMSLYNFDILLLQYFEGGTTTGIYKAALVVAEFLWFAPIAVQTVYIHSSSELWSKGKVKRISKMISRTTRYNILLTGLLALGIGVLAGPFISLYFGSEFKPAVEPLIFLLPGAFGFAIARPIFAVGQGSGNIRMLIYSTGAAALLNICLNWILIPNLGMKGAAIATSVSYGSMLLLHVAAAHRLGFTPVRDLRLSRIAATFVLSFPFVYFPSQLLTSPILSLLVVPLVGFVIYSSLAVYSGALDSRETILLVNSLPDPIRKYVEGMNIFN